MKNLGILSLLLLLAFSSCRKDIEDIKIIKESPDPTVIEGYVPNVQTINGSLIGFVVDANQEPVTDAAVKMGNLTTTTDAFGHFFFNGVDMNALGTFVQIEKAGYFEGSRRFFPQADAKSRVKIELLEKNFNLSFNTASGGLVSLSEGGSIKFKANSIKNEDGTLYNGVVRVAAKWMDPTNLRTFDQMPGNLQGVGLSTLNEEAALATYGMMAVALEGEGGEKLNIADDNTATLTMPVPEILQANAPAEIILWAFNEEFGVWHEQSKAFLQDGAYVGEVSHFSFWNCDVPLDYAQLSITLLDENGVGVSNVLVRLSATGIGCAAGYTNENGVVSGAVPANVELFAWVYDLCSDVLATANLGSFSTNSTSASIISPILTVNNTTITGNLVCDGMPIEEGMIRINYDGFSQYFYLDNTPFEIMTTVCASTEIIEVTGISLLDLEQSESVSATPQVQNDLGNIDACVEGLAEYIKVTVDGVTAVYASNLEIGSGTGFTYFWGGESSSVVSLSFPGATVGSYDNEAEIYEGFWDDNKGWNILSGEFGVPFTSFTITQYGAIGEAVEGNFEGIMTNTVPDPNAEVLITGSFRIIRTE